MTHHHEINGMTCSYCVAKVKNELLKLGDVTGAEVSACKPQATIHMAWHISLLALLGSCKQRWQLRTIRAAENNAPLPSATIAASGPIF